MLLIQKEENMKKLKVNNNIYYYELSSIPNVGIIGITLYMWKRHNLEIVFTSVYVLNIQDYIAKLFGSQ